jgi:hypothetical protein
MKHAPARPTRSADDTGLRVAFYGRAACASEPSLSIHRQLHAVLAVLPGDAHVVDYFADTGPWSGLDSRSWAATTVTFNGTPVRGGMTELLHHAHQPERRFDSVACSSADRLSCRPVDLLRLDDAFAQLGLHVITAGHAIAWTPLWITHGIALRRPPHARQRVPAAPDPLRPRRSSTHEPLARSWLREDTRRGKETGHGSAQQQS